MSRMSESSRVLVVFFALTLLVSTKTFAFTKTLTTTTFYHGLDNNSFGSKGRGGGALYAENGGALGKKAYNDDALFNFHMMTQAQKIRDYSAMDTYINTQSLWNLAWHDSFVRNGLSDFVPPLTDSLNVLVVGNRYQGPTGEEISVVVENGDDSQLRTNDDPGTSSLHNMDLDPVQIAASAPKTREDEETAADSTEAVSSLQKTSQDSSCSFLAAIFDYDSSNDNKRLGDDGTTSNALDLASYDCIMDQGLIADLLSDSDSSFDSKSKENIARLLYEATKRIREMGVYVANTPPMSIETKEYLSNLGQLLGLQWEFDLDGISDENLSVSVARKFGTCPPPSFSKLTRVIE